MTADLLLIDGQVRSITWHDQQPSAAVGDLTGLTSAALAESQSATVTLRPLYGPYQLAGWCYQSAIRIYELTDRPPGTYIRRFVAIAPGAAAQAAYNQGDHLLAAIRIIDALESWEVYRAWTNVHAEILDDAVLEVGVDSYLRHNADLLGRLNQLLPVLAEDAELANNVLAAIRQQDWQAAKDVLRMPGWRLGGAQVGGIQWWDE